MIEHILLEFDVIAFLQHLLVECFRDPAVWELHTGPLKWRTGKRIEFITFWILWAILSLD